jgi:Ser/Thr protein kinase RdoA (MazF antagonist)
VAALSRGVRRGKAAAAAPQVAGRLLAGEMAVGMMTEGRGFSNAKAMRELGWKPRYASWRQGFKEELAPPQAQTTLANADRMLSPDPCSALLRARKTFLVRLRAG